MAMHPTQLAGATVVILDRFPGPADGGGLVNAAFESGAQWVGLPVEHLPDGFLDLSTGIAGEIAQKCVNYRIGLAVIGDLKSALARSGALRDWVRECNAGSQVWFVAHVEELEQRLARRGLA